MDSIRDCKDTNCNICHICQSVKPCEHALEKEFCHVCEAGGVDKLTEPNKVIRICAMHVREIMERIGKMQLPAVVADSEEAYREYVRAKMAGELD